MPKKLRSQRKEFFTSGEEYLEDKMFNEVNCLEE
jgi:hypothetical protein